MSSKPKYYYDLSIYGPKNSEANSDNSIIEKPHGWYFPLGLGKHIISFAHSSKANVQKLTTKGGDLLQYASSLEGKVKLGFIASCTCLGGIVTLALWPPGRVRKLFYPTLFLATSSSICYPSSAYVIAKKATIITYNGGEKAYKGAKVVANKVSDWTSARESERAEMRSDAEVFESPKSEETPRSEDAAPLLNAPILDSQLQDEGPAQAEDSGPKPLENPPLAEANQSASQVGKEGTHELSALRSLIAPIGEENATANDSIEDPGQSSEEDSDLYTTRS